MKEIDIESWNRRSIYNTFIQYTNPIFSASTRLDVTELHTYSHQTQTSFFANFMFIAVRCLNNIEEFRLRLKGGKVVLYDVINPSFIVKSADGGISTCRVRFSGDYAKFYASVKDAKRLAERGQNAFNNSSGDVALYYITCMPWVDLVSFSNPYDLKNVEQSSIPRLMWSKFVDENGRLKMTFDIAVHHALLDGEPVCRAFMSVQNALNSPADFLK